MTSNYKPLFSREDISREVARMGKEITVWCRKVWTESHTDVIAIPVLRGGIFLFADLVREIDCSVEIAPARTWAYQKGENAVQLDQVQVSLDGVPAQGRHILLIDDICDTGRTLKALSDSLLKLGALEVRSAVLIKRDVQPEIVKPEYVAFNYSGKEWIIGYGMDDAERWRNLPYVGILQPR